MEESRPNTATVDRRTRKSARKLGKGLNFSAGPRLMAVQERHVYLATVEKSAVTVQREGCRAVIALLPNLTAVHANGKGEQCESYLVLGRPQLLQVRILHTTRIRSRSQPETRCKSKCLTFHFPSPTRVSWQSNIYATS